MSLALDARRVEQTTRTANPAWLADFGARLSEARRRTGIPQTALARAVGVSLTTVRAWEQGLAAPRPWRFAPIAAALGVPTDSLLVPNPHATCVTAVWISAQTMRDIRAGGRPAALEAAQRLALLLEPELYRASTGRLPKGQQPARAKPRRTRLEVLQGVKAASEARTKARLAYLEGELAEISAEPEPDA